MADIIEFTQGANAPEQPQVQTVEQSADAASEFPSVQKVKVSIAAAKKAFIEWLATPERYRDPQTQKQFGEKYGFSETAISRWKCDARVVAQAEKLSIKHARHSFADIMASMVAEAKDGNVAAQRLFLQYVMGWHERIDVKRLDDVKEEWVPAYVEDGQTSGDPVNFPSLPTRVEPKETRVN